MTTLTPPLKMHGGKHYLAKRIVGLMPPHLHYVEPYFGGGSVLLARDPEGVSEVVNDIDGALMNFWECLASVAAFKVMERTLGATPFSQPVFVKALDLLEEPPERWAPVDRAIAFFRVARQSFAGRMDTFAPITTIRTRCKMNEQASAWLSAIDGLPAVHERLKRVVILNQDALEVIRKQDGPKTLFYLDPPYLKETRTARDVYKHEMTREQHMELLFVLSKITGTFMLSGYRSELYDAWATEHNWRREEFELPNHAASGTTKRRMTECVWMNYP